MKRFLFIVAAMLLSMGAMAQTESEEPVKGDVNGDGQVDVADIVAVIDIMQKGSGHGGRKTYYWYVGHITEDNAMNNTYLTNLVNGKNGTTSTTGPSTLTIPNTSGDILLYIYPTIWGTPTITFKTYGTGDDTFENAGLTSPTGYNVRFWPGDSSVCGQTLDITWTK